MFRSFPRLMLLLGMTWTLAVFCPAQVAAEFQLSDLQKFESKAYVLRTNLPRAEAAEFGAHMDLIFREYSRRFSALRGEERGKQTLFLLRTREDYIAFMRQYIELDASMTGGIFFDYGRERTGLATWTQGLTRSQIFNTLQHEGFHQFAHARLGGELPLWVNEGLAEYFGSAILVDGKVRLGVVEADRLQTLRQALDRGQALAFDQLLNITGEQWRQNMAGGSSRGKLQYDQSWSIVHFLIHGDGGRYQKAFETYLSLLSRGRDHPNAFAQAFGTEDTGPFAERWLKFLEILEPDAYSTALQRLQFLASGAGWLHSEGQAVTDLETLRTALQQRQFRVTYQTPAGRTVTDAADDALYTYEDAEGHSQEFLVTPATDDQPATIAAPQLRPAAHIAWEKSDGDPKEFRPEVVFK